ncbi:hypothetical protein FA09DRAFT_241557 [Tilletiopsis washingtonensis]|uniref:C2H2-type domain-containing protein n=1 Tax=Tilletiopsis washingtonensis TaxID=58919 RepID=A0A316ZC34_9BASI|nr:hypothetical protein FA09DRAFT_241557 [Tilletiopsis washingtonensis]PWN99089.1 hypothetical protein FA09DRAFT_241557 [Tilletiopsis washingtonensis]
MTVETATKAAPTAVLRSVSSCRSSHEHTTHVASSRPSTGLRERLRSSAFASLLGVASCASLQMMYSTWPQRAKKSIMMMTMRASSSDELFRCKQCQHRRGHALQGGHSRGHQLWRASAAAQPERRAVVRQSEQALAGALRVQPSARLERPCGVPAQQTTMRCGSQQRGIRRPTPCPWLAPQTAPTQPKQTSTRPCGSRSRR